MSFYQSPYNDMEGRLRSPIHLLDVTLREGQQAPGVAFSAEGEQDVVAALVQAGVRLVQAGYAARDEATVRRLHAAFPELALAVLAVGWSPELTPAALAECRRAGASVCSILMRSSPSHLANLGLSADDAVGLVGTAVGRARAAGFDEVVVAPSFTTLAEMGFLVRIFEAGLAEGASVISIADSTGIARPGAVATMVAGLRERFGPEVGIKLHMHNDYGLALANTLAGLEAGADWVDTSVLGLGERAGNCTTEELVVALRGLYGVDIGVDPAAMTDLCRTVAAAAGIGVPPMKPVVGENVFANKLELHVKAIASDPTLLEPYDPAAVGGRRTLRLGRGTGPTGVRMKAAELGLELPDELVDGLVTAINERAADGSEVTDEAFGAMVEGARA